MVIEMNRKKVSVLGLGYVGLPLAMLACSKGHEVIGIDKKVSVIDMTNKGISHIKEDFLLNLFKDYNIKAQEKLDSSDIYIICVPTPVDGNKDPDLSCIIEATKEISEVLEDNQLILVESTIYPGVCEEIIKPILDKSNKKYFLAHCPERINPGDEKWNVSNIPRVVGGLTKKCGILAKEFYDSILDTKTVLLSQIKAAEATKILENTFRDVNIAFINEMAQSFYNMDIDIKEVIRGASSKPFGFMPHYPSIGVGGHCIAVDPYYMIQRGKVAGFNHEFLIRARKINSEMSKYTANLIQDSLNELSLPIKGTKISILGLSYKPNIADDRESPSYDLIKILKNKGADLKIFDPYFTDKSNVKSLSEAINDVDCIVIATSHKEFLDDLNLFKNCKLLVDGKNCLNKNDVLNMGIIYRGIGVK
jgi:UDP-N-acetyl-D-glucosamine dehydrogenase